jgi:hypothetical protein
MLRAVVVAIVVAAACAALPIAYFLIAAEALHEQHRGVFPPF